MWSGEKRAQTWKSQNPKARLRSRVNSPQTRDKNLSPYWAFVFIYIMERTEFSSVQSLSHVQIFATPWIAAHQASLSITNSRSSLRLTSIESVMPSSHLNLCCPLLLLPPIPPSIRVSSNESTLHMRWPKYWSFSFSISPSKEHPGLISFRMDWLDLLAVQGTLKSLLQHHSSKASVLWRSAFFTVQLSHAYTTTGKTIALTRRFDLGLALTGLISLMSYVSVVPYSGPTNTIPGILCERPQGD